MVQSRADQIPLVLTHSVGERCHVEEFVGTVRYVGQVDGTSGTWYGIEWDKERGKHDGTYNGIKYFTCRPNHGSFVRPHKAEFGVGVRDGMSRRYGHDSVASLNWNELYVQGHTSQRTAVESVGFEKIVERQSKSESLYLVDLSGLFISHASSEDELPTIIPNVMDLDLSRNLISSAQEILKMVGKLQKLEILKVSENRLSDLHIVGDGRCRALKVLFINRMDLSWDEALAIVMISEFLRELHACFNRISVLRVENDFLHRLEVLNLEGNEICDWSEVLKLSSLSCLKKLILNGNKIQKVDMDTHAGSFEVGFAALASLSLVGNLIDQWHSLNQLNKIQNLTDLRFKSNPLVKDMTCFDLRQELISRLPRVECLNGGLVTKSERKSAELAYLKKYSLAWSESKSTTGLHNRFKLENPIYELLVAAHGAPLDSVQICGKALKENLLSLKFRCGEGSSERELTKSVPATLSIQQLKGIIQRLYRVPSAKQKLSYCDAKTTREVEMDDNLRQLSFYSIQDGDTVIIRL